MSTSYIDEYLVRLGASVDASGMQRFNQALSEATAVSQFSAKSIAGAFFKTQVELTAGFAAIGAATLGLVDKVAMADQSYRLFAMHMYMSKDAARGLKVAMDALDQPLENLTWDKELNERTHQLLADQRAMAPGKDFEASMRKVRDIRFEFTRMEVEGQYMAMRIVEDFLKALGAGPDTLLAKLKKFNDWIVNDMPNISAKLVHQFLPIWNDMQKIANELGHGIYSATGAFTHFVGIMSGDHALAEGANNAENFATALEHVAHFLAKILESMVAVENHGFSAFKSFGETFRGAADWALGDRASAKKWFDKARQTQVNDAGPMFGANSKYSAGDDFKKFFGVPGSSNLSAGIHGLIDKYAREQGVDPALAHAIAMHESGENQYDKSGGLLRNPGSSATGVFQLLNGTAKTMGVDSTDTDQNVRGGIKLLRTMLDKYHGDLPEAIGAYQVGGGMMDRVLAGKATLSDVDKGNIGNILQRMGQSGDVHVGSITIHIDKPNATKEDIVRAVTDGVQNAQNKGVQRNLAQFQDHAWSY